MDAKTTYIYVSILLYALAQMGAFQFLGKIKEDKDSAWQDYYKLCLAGGTKGYFDLLKYANLKNPFEEETIKEITANVMEEISKQKNNI